MLTVSFQGLQLSQSQRSFLANQQRAKALLNPVLQAQVNQTIEVLEHRKETGAKPERVWFIEREESGTPSFAEWMGY